MEKTTTQTTTIIFTPNTNGATESNTKQDSSTSLLSGVSLREKKLAEKVKSLSERLHEIKVMTINSHVQKHMYRLQSSTEWQELQQTIHKIASDNTTNSLDKALALEDLQSLAISLIAYNSYVGALQDHYNDICYDGTAILDSCLEDFNPHTDTYRLDVTPFINHQLLYSLLNKEQTQKDPKDF